MRWQTEHKEMLKMLAGSQADRRAVYDWLMAKVVAGEALNFGYRRTLEHLHAEFSK